MLAGVRGSALCAGHLRARRIDGVGKLSRAVQRRCERHGLTEEVVRPDLAVSLAGRQQEPAAWPENPPELAEERAEFLPAHVNDAVERDQPPDDVS